MAVRSLIVLLIVAGAAACSRATQPLTLIPVTERQESGSPDVIEQNLLPVSPDTSFLIDNSPLNRSRFFFLPVHAPSSKTERLLS